MSDWTSAGLLDRFWARLGRGNGGVMQADELWTAARSYEVLADAQETVYADLAPVAPLAFVSAPVLLTSSDGGVTFSFAAYPFAHVEVYAQESGGRQLFASSYGSPGGDFIFTGSTLRSPGNRVRTYLSGPWARYTGFPTRMDASTQPSLQPLPARELILYQALIQACGVWGAALDPAPFETLYGRGLVRWATVWKTQDSTSGAAGSMARDAWWMRLDAMNGAGL